MCLTAELASPHLSLMPKLDSRVFVIKTSPDVKKWFRLGLYNVVLKRSSMYLQGD